MKVGFIGLGIMGRPMADHLLQAGHTLFLYDLAKLPKELLSAGALACASGKEVATNSEVVITMVPDTPDVERALFDPGASPRGCRAAKSSSI
jgi:2-hydroxy-3-oxopropionate reductase